MKLLKEKRITKLQRNWDKILLTLSEQSPIIEQAINILSYTI
jgi:hypothetical protein